MYNNAPIAWSSMKQRLVLHQKQNQNTIQQHNAQNQIYEESDFLVVR